MEHPPAGRAGNKVRTYLFYAVGEIMLVVIGIVIALQINNWNERRVQRELEQEYYCQFLEDANQDKQQLFRLIAMTEERLKAANQLVRILQHPNPRKIDVGRAYAQTISSSTVRFIPNSAAYSDLTSGSNLNIIQDNSIKKSLSNYFTLIDGYNRVIQSNNDLLLNRYNKHSDLFESGYIHARLQSDRFMKGMEDDVYKAMEVDTNEVMNAKSIDVFLNDGLHDVSIIYRRKELYNYMIDEVNNHIANLEPKCVAD